MPSQCDQPRNHVTHSLYQFKFLADGHEGLVVVFPAFAWVYWFGGSFDADAASGALATAILQARIAYAEARS
jgi:hypothetical protein